VERPGQVSNGEGGMNQIISLSGGKDSTAMLHMMIERHEPIHSVVFLDTGWEFPEMLDHLCEIERKTSLGIVRLQPKHPFHTLFPRKGWPSFKTRWCTQEKVNALKKHVHSVERTFMDFRRYGLKSVIECIGFAYDERHRLNTVAAKRGKKRFPLIEWKITEAEALSYCYGLGYTWGGLYNYFDRVSCFCCPLQRIGDVRILRRHFPSLWSRMLDMDSGTENNRGFNHDATVHELDKRFAEEDKQIVSGKPKLQFAEGT